MPGAEVLLQDEAAEPRIATTDPDGRFTFFNSTAMTLTGYSEDQLKGRHFLKLIPNDVDPTSVQVTVTNDYTSLTNFIPFFNGVVLTSDVEMRVERQLKQLLASSSSPWVCVP